MSYQIAKARLSQITFATIGAIALAGCTTNLANAETMTVYNLSSDDTFIQFGQAHGIGDKIIWRSAVETEAGEALGIGSGHCVKLDAAENYFCSFLVELDDRGTIAGHGIQRTEPQVSLFPIIGGTGEFEGIVGQIETQPVEDRARFKYVITYQ